MVINNNYFFFIAEVNPSIVLSQAITIRRLMQRSSVELKFFFVKS